MLLGKGDIMDVFKLIIGFILGIVTREIYVTWKIKQIRKKMAQEFEIGE